MRVFRLVLQSAFAVTVLLAVVWFVRPEADPSPAARALAERLAEEVAAGRLSDCRALARFAVSEGRTPKDWNVFIPQDKVNWPLGVPIGLVGVERPVKLEGSRSGYRPRFRKGYGPDAPEGTAHDQAHHFAPYYLLGRGIPASFAETFLELAERPESWGDLELGRAAIGMGADGSTAGFAERFCLPTERSSSVSAARLR